MGQRHYKKSFSRDDDAVRGPKPAARDYTEKYRHRVYDYDTMYDPDDVHEDEVSFDDETY
jgi:hypothetical protein